MGEIVYAAAVSHTAQMIRSKNLLDERQSHDIYGAWEALSAALEAARPDALVVAASEHFKTFHLDNMPAFSVGLGDKTRAWGEGGVPKYEIPLHGALSEAILAGLLDEGFDVAYSRDMPLDHGFACPLHFLTPKMNLPVVPIFVNCFAPPLPAMGRCHALGAALARVVAKSRAAARVAVVGTGGLSHWLPAPRFGAGADAEDERMIAAMTHAGDDDAYLQIIYRRIARMVEDGTARVNEKFDRTVMDALADGHAAALAERGTAWVEEHGGNGGQEIRNWIFAAGAAGDRPAATVAYHPVTRWVTGIGFMQWRL
jgi:aromatic ring-opening dioxygenase catalytic subunit (LigB family)